MALINCKNCGQTMSDQAENCPHCGYDFKAHAIRLTISYSTSLRSFAASQIPVWINGEVVNVPTAKDSSMSVTLNPGTTTLMVGPKALFKKKYSFEAKEKEHYSWVMVENPFLFGVKFKLTDSNGTIILQKKRSIKRLLLFLILFFLLMIFFL